MSDDGCRIAFTAEAFGLGIATFVSDCQLGTSILVTSASENQTGPSISANGDFVAAAAEGSVVIHEIQY